MKDNQIKEMAIYAAKMRLALIWLAGAATASSFWVAVLWGHTIGDVDYSGLWAIPVIISVATIVAALIEATNEER